MVELKSLPVHTGTSYEDHSGISTASFSNPYDALIEACSNDVTQIQSRYATHRETRNTQQKSKLLAKDFPGVNIDPILLRLEDATVEPNFVDPRHCLVFWARPTEKIKDIIQHVQQELLTVAPNLWLMPRPNLHITALEVTHSKQAPEISSLVTSLTSAIPSIVDYTYAHRTRLIKPTISFDASALALSFVPAAGEKAASDAKNDDTYTYHHLRKDLYALVEKAGVQVDSRYVVPSSHLTIGRFIYGKDFEGEDGRVEHEKIEAFISKIEEVNEWLRREFWPEENGGEVPEGGDWIVGQEKGLVCRYGTLWYGGGHTVSEGKGF
ncbi:hypothetical protein BU24DRAFT_267804 [Aaosphaeria arxii CBS 175.79]|uniref:RNA ligase/cyclic nucleotide phosphodiesterase n=1 Tax=Aaosphaeria arxii CBS 175.79 TaxID=1450172 RepID=A0A6A5XFK7_9PLEO|nr:uncharacterized protein BU24DRAFT_267804 [Aaosphaeria arxii CBS 175.79]KAF2012025.1 hypothetical protein BU24DRAFT_267804 [Aaosphaeria arxii CBS 175.79]